MKRSANHFESRLHKTKGTVEKKASKFASWYGLITVKKGEDTETLIYVVDDTTRIDARQQLEGQARKLKGNLKLMKAIG